MRTYEDLARDHVGGTQDNANHDKGSYPMEYHTDYQDFIGRHVIVKTHQNVIGYAWGGEPGSFLDTPGKVYVTIQGADYAIPTTHLELVNLNDVLENDRFDINDDGDERQAG